MRTRSKVLFATIAGLIVALVALNAYSAEKKKGPSDRKFVPSTNGECAGVPSCVSTTFAAVAVQAGRRQSTRLECPADHPIFWGWDVAHHENLQIDLASSETGAATIQGINKSASDGEFVVSLGCSTEPVAGASASGQQLPGSRLLKSRVLGPTDGKQKRKQRTIGKGRSLQSEDPCTFGDDGNPVPDCQAQQQQPFFLWGWHTGRIFFDCQAPYPYVWDYSYTEADGSGVTSIGYQFAESPQSYDIWFTNWSIYQTGSIVVTLACSKTSSWKGDPCGPVTDDPQCPIIQGSTVYNCSKTFPGVCFSTHKEQCSSTSPILDCTIDYAWAWCQAECP
jgi:hypothetical protein